MIDESQSVPAARANSPARAVPVVVVVLDVFVEVAVVGLA